MINIGTIFKCADNSGLKRVKNINLLNNKKKIQINTISIAVVEKGKRLKTRIKESDIIKTLIVKTKHYHHYLYKGSKFHNNSVALLHDNKLACTKLKGLLPSILKHKTYKTKINLKKATFI